MYYTPQRVQQIDQEFKKFYEFYWGLVLACKNYGQLTGKNYLSNFPTLTVNGKVWEPNDNLTTQQKDELMDMIVKHSSMMKQVSAVAMDEAQFLFNELDKKINR